MRDYWIMILFGVLTLALSATIYIVDLQHPCNKAAKFFSVSRGLICDKLPNFQENYRAGGFVRGK